MALYVALIILVPIIGSFIIPLTSVFGKTVRNVFALLLTAATFALTIPLIVFVAQGGTETIRWQLHDIVSLVFVVDSLSVFVASVSSFISALIVLYSIGYISHYENQNEYYLIVVLFVGSMMGIVFSANLFMIYTFWEIAAIACWRLIGFFRGGDTVWKANKAFLITVFGALVMLIGFILLYGEKGTADLTQMKGQTTTVLITMFLLFGILSKSATLPLQVWLPDAGVAPTPVTAILHAAVLVKIGIYVFARIFSATLILPEFWQQWLPILLAASSLVSAGAAFIDTDIKRIIAYSTISQIGFIFLGLTMFNPIGTSGGILYILVHGLGKAGLFLCAGIVEQNTHIKDIRKLGGLFKRMPITTVAFALCAFSIMGIPPLGGFFAKYQVISSAVVSGKTWIAGVFVLAACMTMLYLFRVLNTVFLAKNDKSEVAADVKEGSPLMLITVVTLAVLSLASGFLMQFPLDFIQTAAAGVGHVASVAGIK